MELGASNHAVTSSVAVDRWDAEGPEGEFSCFLAAVLFLRAAEGGAGAAIPAPNAASSATPIRTLLFLLKFLTHQIHFVFFVAIEQGFIKQIAHQLCPCRHWMN